MAALSNSRSNKLCPLLRLLCLRCLKGYPPNDFFSLGVGPLVVLNQHLDVGFKVRSRGNWLAAHASNDVLHICPVLRDGRKE